MTFVDYFFISIILFSFIFGCYRGFIKESLSLTGWILGFYTSNRFSEVVAEFLPFHFDYSINFIVAYLFIFILILIGTSLLIKTIDKFANIIGLGFSNLLIGSLFGVIRGILAVYLIIFLVERTSFVVSSSWLGSSTIPIVKSIVQKTLSYLPYEWSNKVKYKDTLT